MHFDSFEPNRQAVYAAAVELGVNNIICVGTSLDDSHQACHYAQSQPGVWAAAGVHPHAAEEFLGDGDGPEKLARLLQLPKVVAVGEIGLDYYKSATPKLAQEKALRLQLEAGLPTKLPFSFHVRDAWKDFWHILDSYPALSGVVHSFSSGSKQLEAGLSRGLYIGLNGIMTFTRDEAQLEAARQVPLERLLLETDAPFLCPAPYRNETCQPKHIVATAEFLAKLRDQPLAEIAQATTKNAAKLFGI